MNSITSIIVNKIVDKINSIINPRNKYIWVEIRNGRKDMPKKSQEILYRTDTGYTFVGYWNAHEKAVYHYNVDFNEGKIVSCRLKRFRSIVAWTNIPEDNEDWE